MAQQINNQEKFITKMDKDTNKILLMILDMQKTYTKYHDKYNKANNWYN